MYKLNMCFFPLFDIEGTKYGTIIPAGKDYISHFETLQGVLSYIVSKATIHLY